MPVKIGIPRTLHYYWYYPFWAELFRTSGAETIISPPTDKEILAAGLKYAVADACLPVKLAFGHTAYLRDHADFIFLPRLVSCQKNQYNCPKILGLSDMIKNNIPALPQVIDDDINFYKGFSGLDRVCLNIAMKLHLNSKTVKKAIKSAKQKQRFYKSLLQCGLMVPEALDLIDKGYLEDGRSYNYQTEGKNLRLAVVGHCYNLYDQYINLGLLNYLQRTGIQVLTAEMVPEFEIAQYTKILPKKMFWTMGSLLSGALLYYADSDRVDGIICLSSFGCGPDAIAIELSKRLIERNSDLPFLLLTLDEHSGEAGMITRLEAFIDMIEWRCNSENNISAYG